MTMLPVNLSKFEQTFKEIENRVKDVIYKFYTVKCQKCGSDTGIVRRRLVSLVVDCPNCQKEIIMGRAKRPKGKRQNIYLCPHCNKQFSYANQEVKKEIYLETEYECTKCKKKGTIIDPSDKMEFEPKYWYPRVELRYPSRKPFRAKRRFDTVAKLFTKRNLSALSILYHEIEQLPDEGKDDQDVKDLIKFVFSSMLHLVSRLIMLKRGKEAGWNTPEYLVLGVHPEYNVWDRFENRYKKILRGKQKVSEKISYYKEAEKFDELLDDCNALICRRSALDLENILSESIDYVFTDPPYGGSIQYSELSLLRTAWLVGEKSDPRFPLDFWKDEITINNNQGKNFEYYHTRLHSAFREIFRVLKSGKFLTVTFHNKSVKVYNSIIRSVVFAGFELERIIYQPPAHISSKSGFHPYTSPEGDFYIRFKKPKREIPIGQLNEREMDASRANRIILDSIIKILIERGEPSTFTDILKGQSTIYSELKKHGYRFFGADPENVQKVLKDNKGKEFVFLKGKGWWFKDPSKHHPDVPLNERVEIAVVQRLTRELASFDEILEEIYLNFQNAKTPDPISVSRVLEEYAEPAPNKKWRLKITVRKREQEHSRMMVYLAELGKKMGFDVWIGTREQGETLEKKRLSSWATVERLSLIDTSPNLIDQYLKNIDVLWLLNGKIVYSFEVEFTTAITEAFNRCSNIPETHRTTKFIVIPEERESLLFRKINSELLKERVVRGNWNFIYFGDLQQFYEENKRKRILSPDKFGEIASVPSERKKEQETLEKHF
jgi:ribosomal protein S27E